MLTPGLITICSSLRKYCNILFGLIPCATHCITVPYTCLWMYVLTSNLFSLCFNRKYVLSVKSARRKLDAVSSWYWKLLKPVWTLLQQETLCHVSVPTLVMTQLMLFISLKLKQYNSWSITVPYLCILVLQCSLHQSYLCFQIILTIFCNTLQDLLIQIHK